MLRIYTLGRFEVWRGRHPIHEEEWRTEVHKTLLKVLITDPGRTFPHDELIECLWPEAEHPSRHARTLRARVCELRRILDPSLHHRGFRVIRTARGGYRLDPDPAHCWVDFLEMQGLVERGRAAEAAGEALQAIDLYKRAVALYRGEFLPEDRHREWTQPRREQLRGLHREALARLVRLLAQRRGREEEAIEYAERGLLADPYDEALCRALMQLYSQTGRPALALQVYERCVRALSELELEPAAETQQLAEAIRKETSEVRNRPKGSIEIRVRRPEEAARLRERLQSIFQDLYQDPERTIRDAREVRRRFRELGSALGEAETLYLIASAEIVRARLKAAERALDEAAGCLARFERARRTGSIVEETDVEGAADWADLVRLKVESARGQLLDQRGRFDEALTLYDRALRRAEAWGLYHVEASLLLNIGALHYRRGHLGEAGLHWERARERAERLGLHRAEAKALNNLALLKKRLGNLREARALHERAIERLEPLKDWRGLADAWNNLGVVEEVLGRFDEAEAAYTRALELSEQIEDRLGVAIQEMNLGGLAILRRRYREARERLERALKQFEALEQPHWEAEALMRLAWLGQERGQHERALAYAEESLRRLGERSGPSLSVAHLRSYAAVSLAELGRAEEARRQAEEAARLLAEEEGAFSVEDYGRVEMRYRLWRAFQLLGDREQAHEQLERAYTALRKIEERLDPEHKKGFWRVRMHREIIRARQGFQG